MKMHSDDDLSDSSLRLTTNTHDLNLLHLCSKNTAKQAHDNLHSMN